MPAKDIFHDNVKNALIKLYLAIRETTYEDIFIEPIGQILLNKKRLKLIVFDADREEIIQWIT